jgi:hypothetical protein
LHEVDVLAPGERLLCLRQVAPVVVGDDEFHPELQKVPDHSIADAACAARHERDAPEKIFI